MTNKARVPKAAKSKYEGREYLDYEEAGDYLGMKRATLFNYIDDLKIETHKFLRDRRKYLTMADVRRIEDVVSKPWLAERIPDREIPQIETRASEKVKKHPVEEKPYQQLPLPENLTIRNEVPTSDIFPELPKGAMKMAQFVADYKLVDQKVRKMLKDGVLQFSQYTNEKNRPSYCFFPEQIAHNLEILKRHGKLKGE